MNRVKLAALCVVFISLSALVCPLAMAAEPVKIEFMTPLWNEEVKAWYENELIPQFKNAYPGIDVEIMYVTWNEYDDKRILTRAAGIGPDAWLVPSNGALIQGHKGELLPLDKYVEQYKNELNIKDFMPQAIASQQLNGQLFALPNTVNVRTYATSIALFEQAGMNARAPLGDWSNFIRLVNKLTGAYNYVNKKNSFKTPTMSQYFGAVLLESGFDWLTDDWELRFDTPQGAAVVDYFNPDFAGVIGKTCFFRNGLWSKAMEIKYLFGRYGYMTNS